MTDWTVVGFAGHRKLDDPETTTRAIRAALERLVEKHGPLAVTVSAASGADTLFLEEARRLDLPLFVVLPFAQERFRGDFEPNDWARVVPLIDGACHVDVVGGTESIHEAYLESGVRVVDRSDVLLVVWNGKPAGGVGGTADVVSYARQLGKPLITIDPERGEATDERLDRLAPTRGSVEEKDDIRGSVARQFEALNEEAIREGPKARQLVLQVILIHLGGAAVGLLPAVLGWHDIRLQIALSIEVVALITALVLSFPHRHAHHEWIRSRFEAEMCRSFLAIWDLPRTAGALPHFANPWSQRLYRSLSISWYLDRNDPPALGEARRIYLEGRLQHQADYFRTNHTRAVRRVRVLKSVAQIATVGAIVTGLAALGLSVFTHSEPHELFSTAKLLALLLPLVNAAALSVVVANDLGRRATRYRQMAEVLDSMITRMGTVGTWPGLWRIVTETEELLLREVTEWQTMTRFTGESH